MCWSPKAAPTGSHTLGHHWQSTQRQEWISHTGGHTHTNLSVSKELRNPYLKDFQDLICFLLRHDGIIVEAAELSLKPEGINVSGVKILLFGHHHIACVSQLKRQEHVMLDFWLCQWFSTIFNSKSPLCWRQYSKTLLCKLICPYCTSAVIK